ncbi:MAG: hypothetical protein IJ673_08180, partial [Treponema sp.]|nr:hypothetical protein [Treponema sp.]
MAECSEILWSNDGQRTFGRVQERVYIHQEFGSMKFYLPKTWPFASSFWPCFFCVLSFMLFPLSFSHSSSFGAACFELEFESERTDCFGTVFECGTVSFRRNPFLFVLEFSCPNKKTIFLNDDGVFLYEDGSLVDISIERTKIRRACSSILSLFSIEESLSENRFQIVECSSVGGKTVCKYEEQGAFFAPESAIATMDSSKIEKIVFFDSGNKERKRVVYSDYERKGVVSYPTSVFVADSENQSFEKLRIKILSLNKLAECFSVCDGLLLDGAKSDFVFVKEGGKSFSSGYVPKLANTESDIVGSESLNRIFVKAGFKFYKKFITAQDLSNCPFEPSCSKFMLQ